MCYTTTPPRPAVHNGIRNLPPNTAAGAVIPLQSYLDKYVTQFSDKLVPSTPPTLPSDIDPNAYKRVAFSIQPLLGNAVSPYYAGVHDDDTDFSASLVKTAALFAAGQFLSEAKDAWASPGATLASFNAALQARINQHADPRILNAHFPSGSSVGVMPHTSNVLVVSGSPVKFLPIFNDNLTKMIVQSDDPASAVCIDSLGYGYISAVFTEKQFFSPNDGTGVGIWLAGDYSSGTKVRIPCVNDHPDAQLTTTRQMCRLFAMIRLKQLPKGAGVDLSTNTLMQNLLNEPKPGPLGTLPWISPSRSPGVAPLFTIVQDKIGFAGLGTAQTPNVYSEGLIIQWIDASQVVGFNNKIDPGNANPSIRLSGEIAVCWQNLLAELIPGGTANTPMFDPIIDIVNNSLSDFFEQKAL